MPSDPSRPNRWWIAPVLGVVVVATAVTALVARNVYHQPVATAGPPPTTTGAPSSSTPGAEPGSTVVTMTPDVAGSPDGKQVQQVLQTLYDAINQRDYLKWSSVVTSGMAHRQSSTQFTTAYESTSDGTIKILRIDPKTQGDGLSVLVMFHSKQDLADAPPFAHFTCIQWEVVTPFARESDGSLKVDDNVSGANPQTQRCS